MQTVLHPYMTAGFLPVYRHNYRITGFHVNMQLKWHICMFVNLYADMLSGKQAGMCSGLFVCM